MSAGTNGATERRFSALHSLSGTTAFTREDWHIPQQQLSCVP
jgi:hypothetical protein